MPSHDEYIEFIRALLKKKGIVGEEFVEMVKEGVGENVFQEPLFKASISDLKRVRSVAVYKKFYASFFKLDYDIFCGKKDFPKIPENKVIERKKREERGASLLIDLDIKKCAMSIEELPEDSEYPWLLHIRDVRDPLVGGGKFAEIYVSISDEERESFRKSKRVRLRLNVVS